MEEGQPGGLGFYILESIYIYVCVCVCTDLADLYEKAHPARRENMNTNADLPPISSYEFLSIKCPSHFPLLYFRFIVFIMPSIWRVSIAVSPRRIPDPEAT